MDEESVLNMALKLRLSYRYFVPPSRWRFWVLLPTRVYYLPVNPGRPVHPVAPGPPGRPVNPVNPVAPGGPELPVPPVLPVCPVKPGGPGLPVAPVAPFIPVCTDNAIHIGLACFFVTSSEHHKLRRMCDCNVINKLSIKMFRKIN